MGNFNRMKGINPDSYLPSVELRGFMEYNFTLADLFKAYFDCRKHKRNKLTALNFELNLEQNLLDLYKEIKSGKYKIGKCICFIIVNPKPREVWAANFRDRIVHHLVYNFISERFIKTFIYDTYSCLPERGTLKAAKRLLHFTRCVSNNYTKPAYYLKADLSNFFVSIDKNILFELLKKYVDEDWILELLHQIIFHKHTENVFKKSSSKKFKLIPKYKSLFHANENNGLPIGNLTSQFFSNVYLDVMDKFIKENLKCKYYVRYVDDFVILSDNTKKLNEYHKKINDYITKTLKLNIHPKKKLINNIKHGITFLGYDVKPNRMHLGKNVIKRLSRVTDNWLNSYNRFSPYYLFKFFKTINSYFGMFAHIKGFNIKYELSMKINSLFIHANGNYSKMILNSA